MAMNWDSIKGKWDELKADARIQWSKLTDDDWNEIGGHKDKLMAKLEQAYGWTKEETEKHITSHFHKFDDSEADIEDHDSAIM